MDDEIKEMTKVLKSLGNKQASELYYYITNLQEINNNLKEDFKRHIDRINELTNRIEKAVEYIKQYGNLYCLKHQQFKKYYQYEELLNILNGSDE
jgi:hypothetical protein